MSQVLFLVLSFSDALQLTKYKDIIHGGEFGIDKVLAKILRNAGDWAGGGNRRRKHRNEKYFLF